MIQKSKLFPAVVVFALLTGLSACSSSDRIDVAENLGATTGLPEVELRVEDLTVSHRQIRDRFGALETLYIDLRKSTAEQADMVDDVKVIITENESLKRELQSVKTRQKKSELLAEALMDRMQALETGKKIATNKSAQGHGKSTGGQNDSSLIESTPEKPVYAVHLASFRNTAQVNTGWSSLREKFPKVLGGLNAKVETSTLPQLGSFLRLLAGPFMSLTEANTLCETLQLKNQYCKPTPFLGDSVK